MIAVLSDDNPSEQYGINTIEAVARLVHRDLNNARLDPAAARRVPRARLAANVAVAGSVCRGPWFLRCRPRLRLRAPSPSATCSRAPIGAWAAAEHHEAQHAVQVDGLAAGREDPGELVVDPDGGQQVGQPEDEDQVVARADRHVERELPADVVVAAEVQHPVEHVADHRRGAVGERHRDRDGQPEGAVEEAEQPQVDEERAEVDQQVADQAGRDDLGQPEREPPGDRRHQGRESRSVCHALHCARSPGLPVARRPGGTFATALQRVFSGFSHQVQADPV